MKIIVVCAAILLLATGCGEPTYEEQVLSCRKALAGHDFDADPLDEGERLPECDGLSEEDYTALSMNAVLDRLNWLDEDGNFDENKMLENG